MTLKQTGNRKCSDFAERLILQVYWMSMVGSSSLLDLRMDLDWDIKLKFARLYSIDLL